MSQSGTRWLVPVLAGTCVIFLAGAGYLGYRTVTAEKKLAATASELASTSAAYDIATTSLAQATDDATNLATALEQERKKNGEYASQVGELSSTVDTLTKLTTIDPQMLAKYSKVYFLNENYVPAELATITPEFTYDQKRTYRFEAKAYPFLENLMNDANDQGLKLQVVSAYRSFGEQSALKTNYRVTYGAGTANSFSADQGYSEHQLGTTVDFTTGYLGANFNSFAGSDAYSWLLDNAYRYGFVISYPKSNTYYTFEPWHWRFVGIKLATELHIENKHFYDFDQRTINSYLVNLFDPE
ncbi:MAG TPA: M15 family metallopeptidase [Candidatus Paceibacterota bacterium]|nr:M15 family metallopeptidase [Candidatus Paceibacterota bacterium]